jgi:hypothetical protein
MVNVVACVFPLDVQFPGETVPLGRVEPESASCAIPPVVDTVRFEYPEGAVKVFPVFRSTSVVIIQFAESVLVMDAVPTVVFQSVSFNHAEFPMGVVLLTPVYAATVAELYRLPVS